MRILTYTHGICAQQIHTYYYYFYYYYYYYYKYIKILI